LHRARWHARFAQNAHGLRGDQRRLFSRLREHRVACCEGSRNLTHEDRQREVPRADTDDGTERTVRVVRKFVANLRGVVTQEVDRFADFSDGVRQRLARFAHDETHQRMHLCFEQIGGTREAIGARFDGRRLPDRRGSDGVRERSADVFRRRFDNRADEVAMIRRVAHVARIADCDLVVFEHRRSAPRMIRARQQR
jgi:hypothetical protein